MTLPLPCVLTVLFPLPSWPSSYPLPSRLVAPPSRAFLTFPGQANLMRAVAAGADGTTIDWPVEAAAMLGGAAAAGEIHYLWQPELVPGSRLL